MTEDQPANPRADRRRSAGLLVHPSCFPGRFGIGDIGPVSVEFLDWAHAADQTVWQILPLGPPGFGESPYASLSAFAGNPLLISPEWLAEDGLLSDSDLRTVPSFPIEKVDFQAVRRWKDQMLRKAWAAFSSSAEGLKRELQSFEADPLHQSWLEGWALFAALSHRHGSWAWSQWPRALAMHEEEACRNAARELSGEVAFHRFAQFIFFRQWNRVRSAARQRGIEIIGDIPIYMAYDSADVWSRPELFQLDPDRKPVAVSGVPPDYFSTTGQLWGNPLYRWDRMKETGYQWWMQRIESNLRMADRIRIDHFRAFAAYWKVPAGSETAEGGSWEPGPGLDFFRVAQERFGSLPLIAEDLGLITEDVEELRLTAGLPGMKVLQFAFGETDSPYLPHRHERETVVYTGTHDNDTTESWFASLADAERQLFFEYLGDDSLRPSWKMIRAAYESVATCAVIPLQDVFSLGAQARMNTPGKPEENWSYRFPAGLFDGETVQRLRRLVEIAGRTGVDRRVEN